MQSLRRLLSWLGNILIVGHLLSWCWRVFRARSTPVKIAIGCMLLLVLLCVCSLPFIFLAPASSPKPTDTPALASTPAPTAAPALTSTATPDPCTGWWCTITGAVYAEGVDPEQALEGAAVTLGQFSYCSPTAGERETVTGADGRFEFGEVFLHDTDRVWIEVEAEGYEGARWDAVGFDCLFCGCFGSPIEFVLVAAGGE